MSVLKSRTITVSIDSSWQRVYEFASNPANLPLWARAFCLAAKPTKNGWEIETPAGPISVCFVEQNSHGVLDHYVFPSADVKVYVPMRVVANGTGSEALLTLFQPPEMTDAQFADDIAMVERDLGTLKQLLEREAD